MGQDNEAGAEAEAAEEPLLLGLLPWLARFPF